MKHVLLISVVFGLLGTSALAGSSINLGPSHTTPVVAYSPPPPPEKLITIYGNLNKAHPSGLYYPFAGLPILGPENTAGNPEFAIATGFYG